MIWMLDIQCSFTKFYKVETQFLVDKECDTFYFKQGIVKMFIRFIVE